MYLWASRAWTDLTGANLATVAAMIIYEHTVSVHQRSTHRTDENHISVHYDETLSEGLYR